MAYFIIIWQKGLPKSTFVFLTTFKGNLHRPFCQKSDRIYCSFSKRRKINFRKERKKGEKKERKRNEAGTEVKLTKKERDRNENAVFWKGTRQERIPQSWGTTNALEIVLHQGLQIVDFRIVEIPKRRNNFCTKSAGKHGFQDFCH